MISLVTLGKQIKQKRLSLNFSMDEVAQRANITRQTLWSIEKGDDKCSIGSYAKVMKTLEIYLDFVQKDLENQRKRATRKLLLEDKKINEFIIFCIESYAVFSKKKSQNIYKIFKEKNILKMIEEDYEDLHGFGREYLNEHLKNILKGN